MYNKPIESHKSGKFILAITLAATILLLLVLQSAAGKTAVTQPQPENRQPSVLTSLNLAADPTENTTDSNTGNCRYGVASIPPASTNWVSTVGAGWHLNFAQSDYGYDPGNGAEYIYTLRMQGGVFDPPLSSITDDLAAHPGALWLVGSEMEVNHPVSGDKTFPWDYAVAYHTAYNFIKGIDPTAQIGIGGMSMATPGRLQYLDLVWDNYLSTYGTTIPVDVWNVHIYIFAEREWGTTNPGHGNIAMGTDPWLGKQSAGEVASRCVLEDVYCRAEHDSLAIIQQQTIAFRQWMKDHGQQNKPFIITELALLYQEFYTDENGEGFPPARVITFMNPLFDYLENAQDPNLGYPADNNRLVQQWLWFSMHVPDNTTGRPSNLLRDDYSSFPAGDAGALTSVGINFRDYVAAQSLYANLFAGTTTGSQSAAGSAQLTIEFYNNGTMNVNQPFQVTFYADSGLTQLIGSAAVNPNVDGCARRTYTALTNWSGLSEGTHNYWVKIDSGNAVGESNEGDNVSSGSVVITDGGGNPTATHTHTPVPQNTATNTPTPLPQNTATNTPTPLPQNTATNTPTNTPTPLPQNTATNTPTPLPQATATNTPTPLPQATSTHTSTPLPQVTSTHTSTPLPQTTATNTNTPAPPATATNTSTPLPPASATPTPTIAAPATTATSTHTPTPTATGVSPIVVTWQEPVGNDESYFVTNGEVLLEVSVTGNVDINFVRFSWWDAEQEIEILIEDVQIDPYQTFIDVENINLGWNQINAVAYDTSGNQSERVWIWLIRGDDSPSPTRTPLPTTTPTATATPDVVPPSIEWIEPVENDEVYEISGETIQLEVAVEDNEAIAHVNFLRWDVINAEWVLIDTVSDAPYGVEFDTAVLDYGWHQLGAKAQDQAGNSSTEVFIWLYYSDGVPHGTTTPTPPPTATHTATATPTETPVPSLTPTASMTPTPATPPTVTPWVSPTPQHTATPAPPVIYHSYFPWIRTTD